VTTERRIDRSDEIRHSVRKSAQSAYLSVLSLVTFLAVWQLVSWVIAAPTYVLPSPYITLQTLLKDGGVLAAHLSATISATAAGLALAVVAGLLVAMIMRASATLGQLIYSHMVLSQAVPLIAIAPVILIWFGLGLVAKMIIVAAVCFFPIAVNTYEAFRTVSKEYVNYLTTLDASRWQRYRHLLIPATLPGIFAGAKIAATYCVLGAVVGEWLGGVRGIGIYMTRALQSFRTDKLFAAILVVMVVSYAIFKCVSWIGNRLTPWVQRR